MPQKTLSQVVAAHPFADYAAWWSLGNDFVGFMAEAIGREWQALADNEGDLSPVSDYVARYLELVFRRTARPGLVVDFVKQSWAGPLQSGEFDALSYAFYRSAFELIERQATAYPQPVRVERRLFTKRVGRIFFRRLADHLQLDLPPDLADEPNFVRLKTSLQAVGQFLQDQGYLRDHFSFSFRVEVLYRGQQIRQSEADFVANLHQQGRAYALYEMGYPVILPSAVYLYQTLGEAQHHSSRTIEELFERAGCEARETDDFDPSDYPSDRVVELWEIKKSV